MASTTETSGLETIYALASAPGMAGVSVIRVSGPQVLNVYEALTRDDGKGLTARQAHLATLYNPADNAMIDRALCLYFKNPHSFTGEDVLELHVHGSTAIIDHVYHVLDQMHDVRMAEPGEFSKRAYLNGKMDLTEAEAINDLVVAETQAQVQQALGQMQGALRDIYEGWREKLIRAMAYIEADIDFSDEEIPESLSDRMKPVLHEISEEIKQHLDDKNKGEIMRNGFRVAIIGAPNVGKSSLINNLADRDIAIVSDIAGTTRDVLECHINIEGFAVILTDTAGIHATEDHIEKMGIDRALNQIKQAQLKLAVFDASAYPDFDPQSLDFLDDKTVCFINKMDLIDREEQEKIKKHKAFQKAPFVLSGSIINKQGLNDLVDILSTIIKDRFHDIQKPAPTRARHRKALEEAREYLLRGENADDAELVAEDTRMAMRALGRITGRVDVEDLLDVIFKDFCIGK